jgi:hypothetical protein
LTASYDKAGLSFQYPETWELEEEVSGQGGIEVTVHSPTGAFWSVRLERSPVDPRRMTQTAVEAMRTEYEGLEAEPATDVVDGSELEGVDMSFFYLDLTSTAKVRTAQTALGTLLVLCQAEDRDFEQLEPVFDAMTLSLLRAT